MTNIDYKEINNFYARIISKIFAEINIKYPATQYTDTGRIVYSEEHLNAYGWLDKAGWRGGDLSLMKRYYNQPDFKYYGLEILHDIKTRISGYLKETNMEFSKQVYTYNKYDQIVDERMELIKDPSCHEIFMKYWKLESFEQEYKHMHYLTHSILSDIELFEEELTLIENNGYNEQILEALTTLKEDYKVLEDYVETNYSIQ